MSRAGITAAVAAKTEAKTTQPGYLVEIQFPSGVVRHSTRGLTSWNSFVWVASTVKVSGLEGAGQKGRLEWFDADNAMRTIILADGINDQRVRIWKFYAGALATNDPVLVFDGVGDGANMRQGRVSVGLVRTGSRTLMTPRYRIGPATGFNHLAAEGTVIQWAGRTLRLERRRG